MDVFLKVLSDMDCSLYVDGEFVQLIKADSLTKISLRRGEYFIQCTSTLDSTISQSDELLLEYDRIYKVSLLDIILRKKEACEQLELEPRKNEDELYGYYLKGTSKCIIPHKYKEASEFISLYAIVSDGKTRSVILKNGNVSIPFGIFSNIALDIERDQVLGFHVYKKENYPGGWGYISIKYDFLTIADCLYCGCTRYNDFVLCENENGNNVDVLYSLQNGEERLRADEIRIISDPELPGDLPLLFFIKVDGLYGILDSNLDTVIPIEFRAYDWELFHENAIGANQFHQYIFNSSESFNDKKTTGVYYDRRYLNGKDYYVSKNYDVTEIQQATLTIYQNMTYGIGDCDRRTAIAINSRYSFKPNLYSYKKGNRRAKKILIDRTILMITSSGTKKINADTIRHFYGDHAIVEQNGKTSFIDFDGNYVIGNHLTLYPYREVKNFYMGVAIVLDENGYGAINTYGKEIIPCKYKSISHPFAEGDDIIIAFDSEGKETIFNKEGNEVKKAK